MKTTPSKMPCNAPEATERYPHTPASRLARLQAIAMALRRNGSWLSMLGLVNSVPNPDALIGAANIFTVIQDNWVQVSPLGDYWNAGPTRNGRPQFPNGILQRVDGEAVQAMVDQFNSVRAKVGRLFGGCPWYIGHPDGDPANWSDKSAYGWIMALENRGAEGLWAQVKWTDQGEKLKENGAYKYFSPYWFGAENSLFTENGKTIMRPTYLKSVGFVNDPNIPVMPLVNSVSPLRSTADLLAAIKEMGSDERAELAALLNYGTSEGARKGWETRRGGGGAAKATARQKASAMVAAKTRTSGKKVVSDEQHAANDAKLSRKTKYLLREKAKEQTSSTGPAAEAKYRQLVAKQAAKQSTLRPHVHDGGAA